MLGKPSTLALCTLGLALNAHAAASFNRNLITIPMTKPGFDFSVAVLGLKPGASNLNYVIYNKELPAQSPSWSEKEIRPGYGPAFELDAGYRTCEAETVHLGWTHLNTSSSTTTQAPNDSFFLGPDYEIGPAGLTIRNSSGDAQFKYDVVNLDAGQFVTVGNHLLMRLFGGLSNAYLREQVTAQYSGTLSAPFPGPFRTNQEVTSNFTGIGPRFGITVNYDAGSHFGFMGEAAASALIGSMYTKTEYTSSSSVLTALFGQRFNDQFIKDQNVTQVIPGFDAKLGVNYTYDFCNGALVVVGAGYQASVYVNAISQYIPASVVVPIQTGGIFVDTMSHTLSNYSVQGPFLQATLSI